MMLPVLEGKNEFDIHGDAQGTGIVRMSDAVSMDDTEYLLWGHDGAAYEWMEDGYPILSERLTTTWGYSQTGEVGEVTVRVLASVITDPGNDFGLIVGSNYDFLPGDILAYYPLTLQGDYYTATVEFPESGVFTLGVEPAVAVEDLTQTDISVFPNPSEDMFFVQIGQTSLANFHIKVFDALGREVSNLTTTQSSFRLDASDWSAGNYVLRIAGGDQVVVRQLVKF